MPIVRSVCPYDCPDACGLLVQVEGEQIVKVMGDPEHPFTRGTLCPKMAHYEQTVHSPRRLLTPLKRIGAKGSDAFDPCTWEEALDSICLKWQEIGKEFGNQAILPYSYAGSMGLVQRNAGHAFFYHLGASRLERTICSPAKGYGWNAVMGSTAAIHPLEVQASDCIILWGADTLATNIHMLHDLKEARRKGAKVWVINTYRNKTAALADRVIMVRPGTDGALALGMMQVIVAEGLIDKDFIQRQVQGYDELAAQVLPRYSPRNVEDITGVPAALVAELAQEYARATAPFIRLGSGLSRYSNGAMTVRIITCLPALTGAWKKEGGGLLCGTTTGNAFAMNRITREDFQTTPTRLINMNRLGEALNQLNDPPVKSLYVYCSNPAAVAPDQNQVLQGLGRDDLFTVVHERFLTDTARYADFVLPATTSLEHSDIYRSYGHYGVQRAWPAISPLGQSKENWEVFRQLAQRMEMKEPFFQQTADELIDSLLVEPSNWLAQIDTERLQAGKAVELPLAKGYKCHWRTPSGKIEIYNDREEPALPDYRPPHGDAGEFWLINAPHVQVLNSSFNERAAVQSIPKMRLQMHPADAKRLSLEAGQTVRAVNERGEAEFTLQLSEGTPQGVVVTEGIWWLEHLGGTRSVNVLTSQRLTDQGSGSTFYDVKVNVRSAG